MSVIKAKKIEIEVQEQQHEGAAAKWMVVFKYEPENEQSCEVLQVGLTDEKPLVHQTVDTGDQVWDRDKLYPTTKAPNKITTPEELLGIAKRNLVE
tara:strand:- start:114 stop:401 length:288 start_codon:yes stop_codon:yes gene_type:complete